MLLYFNCLKKDTNKPLYLLLFVLALAVNFAGINVHFFTDDPGLYASIAKNLVYKKDFLQLFTYNQDWLDKPHFPFWAVLLSYKLFGISAWAYRLPALFFFCLSLLYTFLFTRKYYGPEVGAIAVLILATALNVQLSNTDVRAEPYLMGMIIGSIYHISCLRERLTLGDLLLAALYTAFAIMTKGIFVIAAIYGSLIAQLVFTNELKSLLNFKWLLLIALTVIFTIPEFYALYTQFDLHPEKTVFDRHNVSGIKWFLWDSQFGRFVNNGPIIRKASGSMFFFLHTLLWAFAPWCLLFYYSIFRNLKTVFNRSKLAEYYTLGGGLLLLLLFSVSRFQLPFYTNAVFPLFAVITAPFCYVQVNRFETRFRLIAQWLFIVLLPVAVVVLNVLLKPSNNLFFIIDCILFVLLIILIVATTANTSRMIFFLNCAAVLFVGFYLNTVFYKTIEPYKGEITAAGYINQQPLGHFPVYSLKAENNVFQFYCNRPVDLIPIAQFKTLKFNMPPLIFVTQASIDYLKSVHANFRVLKSFVNYPQENILPKFINKATRNEVLNRVYIITR